MQLMTSHVPVLLEESISALRIKSTGTYIDCTLGRGGHSQVILGNLSDQGKLLVLDQDPSAVKCAQEKFGNDKRVNIFHQSFANLNTIIEEHGLHENVDGVFFDLGVSSPQLDEAQRGFSFTHDGPLDMRMNTSTGSTAADWLAEVSIDEFTAVLKNFGEERYAKKIAHKVLLEQQQKPINTTKRLADIVKACYPHGYKGVHPATRTFQAIRIAVNQELTALQIGLDAAFEALNNGGRLAVISFHSLEDRIVKRFIRDTKKADDLPAKLPVMPTFNNYLKPVGKLVKPSENEIDLNPRARSARLRVAEKVM